MESIMAIKGTGRKVASRAGRVLSNPAASKNAKKSAASALSQRKSPVRKTSKKVATAASKVMRNPDTSRAAKSVAGSALSQRRQKKKKS
jgi:hypothetical protein